jgi:hypothetical protein
VKTPVNLVVILFDRIRGGQFSPALGTSVAQQPSKFNAARRMLAISCGSITHSPHNIEK